MCQKSRQKDTSGINEKVNENKTKLRIVVFSNKKRKRAE